MRPYAQTQLLLYFSLTYVQVLCWTYIYSDKTMSWTDAEAWCKTKSQKMMLIVNEEENNYLKNHLPKQYYWIGLRKTEGIWKWHGAEKNLTGNGFWAPKEPNSKTKDEDCVEIYINNNQNNGKWNDDSCSKQKYALCYNASCFNNSCGNNAMCVETIGSYTCKCNPGFTGPKCTEVQCPPLAIINGRMDCSHHRHTNSYISTCSFSCEEGFELSGSHKTLCDHNGQWTHSTPNCTAILCKALRVPHGGIVSCHRGNSTICTVQCPSDYLLLGVHEYTCRPDGSWSPFQPLCASFKHMLVASAGGALFSTICCCMFCSSYCRTRNKSVRQNDRQEEMNPAYDASDAPLEVPLSSV
ncbi:P-selectin-like isoform X2 [Silurus meridionalis]|nr:P-selectin-like isoform X2 [Silurus meridionalis]